VNRAVAILAVGLVALLAFTVAEFDPWGWWSAHERAAESAERAAARRFPEGPTGVVQPRPEGTDSSVSPSPRRLILTATRPGRNTREGYADLGVDARSPQTYRAGARLANGARLEEILADHVVLERDGVRTRLYVQGREPAGASPPLAALVSVGGAPARVTAGADSTDPLTDEIRIAPIFEGDAVHALEVYANARSVVFAALGLEPGDRITVIDDVPVTDATAAIASLRRLTEGAALTVRVERGGGVATLALDGGIVVAARRRI
jgi:hypothetical protein